MARIIAIVCALMLTLGGLFSCGEESSAPMGFKEISDEALTYHLYVPEVWVADLSTGITSAYYSGIDPSNISVTAFELDYSVTSLDDYWAMIEPDLMAVFPDLTYVDQSDAKLDGVDAKQYIYTGSMSGKTYKFMQLIAVKSNTIYTFTYTADAAKYDEHIEDVLAILDYFDFK